LGSFGGGDYWWSAFSQGNFRFRSGYWVLKEDSKSEYEYMFYMSKYLAQEFDFEIELKFSNGKMKECVLSSIFNGADFGAKGKLVISAKTVFSRNGTTTAVKPDWVNSTNFPS